MKNTGKIPVTKDTLVDIKLEGCPETFRARKAGGYDWGIPAKGLAITDWQRSE